MVKTHVRRSCHLRVTKGEGADARVAEDAVEAEAVVAATPVMVEEAGAVACLAVKSPTSSASNVKTSAITHLNVITRKLSMKLISPKDRRMRSLHSSWHRVL